MRRYICILFSLIISFSAIAKKDYRKVDHFVRSISDGKITSAQVISDLISSRFSKDDEVLRAVYGWICRNISYDMDRMGNPSSYRGDSAVSETLNSQKAICSGYVDLFINLCRRLNIKAYYVAGYARQNGIVEDLGHAWVAVRLSNGQWKLFDPTWGASVWHNGELVRRLSYEYFMVEPETFIKTHMPFDPMWQLIYQPIKAAEFYGSSVADRKDMFFNYNDSILKSLSLSDVNNYKAILRRMDWCGVPNNASQMYYSAIAGYFALALKDEYAEQYSTWLSALDRLKDRYSSASEMLRQTEDLEKTYAERGVPSKQVSYSYQVLSSYLTTLMVDVQHLVNYSVLEQSQLTPLTFRVAELQIRVSLRRISWNSILKEDL